MQNKFKLGLNAQGRSSRSEVFSKIVPLKTYAKFCPPAFNFVKKETPAQIVSCEFCKSFKKILFTDLFRATTSVKAIHRLFSIKIRFIRTTRVKIGNKIKNRLQVSNMIRTWASLISHPPLKIRISWKEINF